ncbi:hypothetical protein ACQ4M3_09310 [Leptolyngbya sp. AN03gr2]|uniref:hypothetical protein n=1 Tax=Leptolyngbya sp. AN03gr2 TaxID=3423364 RepID=UPI003D31F4F7
MSCLNSLSSSDLEPGYIYLCKGELQQVRWLSLNDSIQVLHEPTTDEFIAAVTGEEGLWGSPPKTVMIVVRDLNTTLSKTKSKFATPIDQLIQIGSNTTVLVWAEATPNKSGKAKVDKYYDALAGAVYRVLDLTQIDYRTHPLIAPLYNQIPESEAEQIYRLYARLPTTLFHQLEAYPNHTLPESETEDEIVEWIRPLGTSEGVRLWSSVSPSDFYRLFSNRIVLESEDRTSAVSWFFKRTGYNSPSTEFPTGFSTRLAFYVQPFITAANRDPLNAGVYLGLFALWCYSMSKEDRAGMSEWTGRNGKTYYTLKTNQPAQRSWTTLCKLIT